ncbi:hypothetical protein [Alcaligenes sp. SDU_A2]|uniref:hypothetical protein n=1 Tax=Alcaligenes sp. SDU_A2 TaxID=3136634 RepID=UPI002BE499AE|nr:hypothetical protein [Alcaligenes sp.]HRL27743.1 hypothetical protein [Alcaligenes sp.]
MTAKESMNAQERAIRIELLRARAALERQALSQQIHVLGEDLRPGNLLRSVAPSGRSVGGLLTSALTLTRRYPLLLSGASTLLSSLGGRWVRLGALALTGWKLYSAATSQQRKKSEQVLVPVRRDSDG